MKAIQRISALIVAGVLLFSAAVFAADVTEGTAQFSVTTKIEQFVGVKVLNSGTEISNGNNALDKPWFDGLTTINNSPVTVGESGSDYVEVAMVAYYANTPFKLTVDLPRLSGSNGNSYTIGYASNIMGKSFTADQGDETGIFGASVVIQTSLSDGASANGGPIEMNLNSSDYNLAPADTYSATIVFHITAAT